MSQGGPQEQDAAGRVPANVMHVIRASSVGTISLTENASRRNRLWSHRISGCKCMKTTSADAGEVTTSAGNTMRQSGNKFNEFVPTLLRSRFAFMMTSCPRAGSYAHNQKPVSRRTHGLPACLPACLSGLAWPGCLPLCCPSCQLRTFLAFLCSVHS